MRKINTYIAEMTAQWWPVFSEHAPAYVPGVIVC